MLRSLSWARLSIRLGDSLRARVRPVAAVIVALGLAACGGDDADPAGAAGGSTNGGGSGATGAGAGGAAGTGGTSGTGAGTSTSTDTGTPLPVDECASPGAGWVFCSSFEEGNKDVWDDYDGNPDETNLLMEDPGPFDHPDNHVMRLRVPPGRGGADLVKVLPSQHDRLYARWYIQWEPGFDFDAPNHGGGLHAGNRDWLGHSDTRPAGDDWYTAWIDYDTDLHVSSIYSYYPGMYMDCADPNGACWGDHFPCMIDEGQTYCTKPEHRETVTPPTLQTGRWYCVEVMLDGGAPTPGPDGASGAMDFWVDGQQIGPWPSLWMRSTPDLSIGILWLSLFHHGDHSVEGVLYDHVVVSTDPIGCGG